MRNILLVMLFPAVLAAQLFPAAVKAAGPTAPFDQPARAAQPYEQHLREQEARQRRQLLTPPPTVEVAPKGIEALRPGGPCVTARSIRVEGARLLSETAVRKLVSPYESQCLNLDGINAVLQKLTNAYVERGYVTSRAVLGPQDRSQGVLVIKIIKGRAESIGPDAASTMQPRQFLTIFPGVKGSVLQLRDIVSEARIVGGDGVTRLGQTGGISADDGLRMAAERDVTLAGSQLTAEGDARISAGRDVNVTTGSSFHGYHLDEDITTNHGSGVAVGGNLQMIAGNDLTVAGSGVAAGRNLSVTAVQDVFKQEIRGSSSGGLLGGSSSSRRNEERVTSKAAAVTAGGNLNLLAGASISGASDQTGHASVVGSNLLSGKDLTVAASGNVNVASSQSSYYYSYSKSSTSTGALGLSFSSKKEGNASLTQVGSNLMGQNVTLDAGKSVAASCFHARPVIMAGRA
ncbi:MAG: hemagglutinin repeat-containing protein [Desulfovibrio sp.]|uniref:POTRA domain-containing protein n=1 Tax=Desulfovibrio sp. TaxID=885 RepID=UPI00258BE0B1|nr:POTRA domain-containing protein [Desulfovibrio sp.]MCD7982910.1 hemagglutinin repeat-containing protein [Desulfovibrio sp.]